MKNELIKLLKNYNFDYEPIIRILYSEDNIKKMIDFIKENEIIDTDDIYFYSFKLANIPVKIVNKKTEEMVSKYNLKIRKSNFVKEEVDATNS